MNLLVGALFAARFDAPADPFKTFERSQHTMDFAFPNMTRRMHPALTKTLRCLILGD